jgi:hypothetical protein
MIKKITNKYYSYPTNEFLPIYIEGRIANKTAYHAYKAKCALKAIGRALEPTAHRIDNYFVNH